MIAAAGTQWGAQERMTKVWRVRKMLMGGGVPHEDDCKVMGESTQRSAGVVLLQDHGAISRPGSEEIDLSRFAEAVEVAVVGGSRR